MSNTERLDLNNENKQNFLPNISEYGQRVLQIVEENRKKAEYKYPGNVYSFLGDPIIPDFGDLNNLDEPCVLVTDKYFTPDCGMDDYSEDCYEALQFDKKMFIEALLKIEPGETVGLIGLGKAIRKYERAGFQIQTDEDKMITNINNDVKVIFSMWLNADANKVIFDFRSKSLNQLNDFKINKSIEFKASEE